MEFEDAVRKHFPGTYEELLEMARIRSGSDVSIRDMGLEEPVRILEEIGGSGDAIPCMAASLSGDSPLAMDFFGPFGEMPGYQLTREGLNHDYRRISNIFVITDKDGVPSGIVPAENSPDHYLESCNRLRGMKCTLVTDRMQYSDRILHTLEKNVDDYLLVQPPFPISFSSTRNAKMQELNHNGRDLKACKIRYEKKWLFRFTDPIEAESVRSRLPLMDTDRNSIETMKLSAGSTDVISNVGHDIREVRRLLDIRERMDSEMRRHRRLLGNDADILTTDEAVIGYLLMSVISTRLSFTDSN